MKNKACMATIVYVCLWAVEGLKIGFNVNTMIEVGKNFTEVPSADPSTSPSFHPTFFPSSLPSIPPTHKPSVAPSSDPTRYPSMKPSMIPSVQPSLIPTKSPTFKPSYSPSFLPSVSPTTLPSKHATLEPTKFPSGSPSFTPIKDPSPNPSSTPTEMPTINPFLPQTPNNSLTFNIESTLVQSTRSRLMSDAEIDLFKNSILSKARDSQCSGLKDARINSVEIISQGINVDGTHLVIRFVTRGFFTTISPTQTEHERKEEVASCLEASYSRLDIVEQNNDRSPEEIDMSSRSRILIIVLGAIAGSLVLAVFILSAVLLRRKAQTHVDNGRNSDISGSGVGVNDDDFFVGDIGEINECFTKYAIDHEDPGQDDDGSRISINQDIFLRNVSQDIFSIPNKSALAKINMPKNVEENFNITMLRGSYIKQDDIPASDDLSSKQDGNLFSSGDYYRSSKDGRSGNVSSSMEGNRRSSGDELGSDRDQLSTNFTKEPPQNNTGSIQHMQVGQYERNNSNSTTCSTAAIRSGRHRKDFFLSEDTSTSLKADVFINKTSRSRTREISSDGEMSENFSSDSSIFLTEGVIRTASVQEQPQIATNDSPKSTRKSNICTEKKMDLSKRPNEKDFVKNPAKSYLLYPEKNFDGDSASDDTGSFVKLAC